MTIRVSPNNLVSLLQVRELVSECQCPTQFPMIRVSEGKYRIGDTQILIFVRVRILSVAALHTELLIFNYNVRNVHLERCV